MPQSVFLDASTLGSTPLDPLRACGELITYPNTELGQVAERIREAGIIITNKMAAWLKELEKIKYKRDKQGRIMLMDKVTFKKEYGFSPDRFDAAITSFFKESPSMPVVLSKAQVEAKETAEWIQRQNEAQTALTHGNDPDFSSM